MTELHIERVLDAPRELVWKAFTDPAQVAKWFGPVGYHVPPESVDIDLRVGGHWRFEMVADSEDAPPGGPVDAVFDEIVENELLVGHENLTGEMAELFGTDRMDARYEFHDEGNGRTRIVLRQGPYTEGMHGDAKNGWESSFTKLDSLLAA